jgi:FkbM family methyltransferase
VEQNWAKTLTRKPGWPIGGVEIGEAKPELRLMFHGPYIAFIRGHHFLYPTLNTQSVVVDLGANRGDFSIALSKRFQCRCYGAEPHPELFPQIPQSSLVSILNCAISPVDGPVSLNLSSSPEGHSLRAIPRSAIGSATVRGLTFQSFTEHWGIDRINLMKVDIEGAEIELLSNISPKCLERIDQMTVEFHDFKEEFHLADDVRRTLGRLTGFGWLPIVFSRRDCSDVLLLNLRNLNLRPLQILYLRYIARYVEGSLRTLERNLPRFAVA